MGLVSLWKKMYRFIISVTSSQSWWFMSFALIATVTMIATVTRWNRLRFLQCVLISRVLLFSQGGPVLTRSTAQTYSQRISKIVAQIRQFSCLGTLSFSHTIWLFHLGKSAVENLTIREWWLIVKQTLFYTDKLKGGFKHVSSAPEIWFTQTALPCTFRNMHGVRLYMYFSTDF